jgi:hypothetical protein
MYLYLGHALLVALSQGLLYLQGGGRICPLSHDHNKKKQPHLLLRRSRQTDTDTDTDTDRKQAPKVQTRYLESEGKSFVARRVLLKEKLEKHLLSA